MAFKTPKSSVLNIHIFVFKMPKWQRLSFMKWTPGENLIERKTLLQSNFGVKKVSSYLYEPLFGENIMNVVANALSAVPRASPRACKRTHTLLKGKEKREQ